MTNDTNDDIILDLDFNKKIDENKDDEQESTEPLKPKKQKSMMEDFFATTLQDYDNFDKQAWSKGSGYKIPGFDNIENKLEGLESGLYLFAAESNVGKSAVMMNLLYNICTYEDNHLFGVYYSLDDGMFEIIPRIVAMEQIIPISVVSKPNRYQELIEASEEDSAVYQDWLDKRKDGLDKLRHENEKFKIVDSSKIKTAKDLYNHIKNVLIYIKSLDQKNNIIVAIDSINDVNVEGKFNNSADKNTEIARMIKDWTVEFNIPIFASTHLRKINANRRPVLDDLKESGEYVYEASVVWLLYNDVAKNKQAAQICQTSEDSLEKKPVIEMDWAKNKKSSYKGRSFLYFSPEYSRVVECGEEASKRFNALVHQS